MLFDQGTTPSLDKVYQSEYSEKKTRFWFVLVYFPQWTISVSSQEICLEGGMPPYVSTLWNSCLLLYNLNAKNTPFPPRYFFMCVHLPLNIVCFYILLLLLSLLLLHLLLLLLVLLDQLCLIFLETASPLFFILKDLLCRLCSLLCSEILAVLMRLQMVS